ncbi:hypothetical protein LUZ60_003550 [Juncus effusus]|nr:hypothetical protein LUZ60_003550 [Juncus effusus]
MPTSDHVPLKLIITKRVQRNHRAQKFERSWLSHSRAKEIFIDAWQGNDQLDNNNPAQKYVNKVTKARNALQSWAKNELGNQNTQLANAKNVLKHLDTTEESRALSSDELKFRIELRKSIHQTANQLEIRWQQRASCNWLKLGDKNTKYFHAVASARRMRNAIYSLNVNDTIITDQKVIKQTFLHAYKLSLGAPSASTSNVDLSRLVDSCTSTVDFSTLCREFGSDEIKKVINNLQKGKSSGPDGLPAEYLKVFWPTVQEDIEQMIRDFHENKLDLWRINQACITLVPKKDQAIKVDDFRPIRVINLPTKIISKLLADRLHPLMPKLIHVNQTAFLKGRSIAESFAVTREVLQFYKRHKIPTVMMKVDFRKAFDNISWNFIYKLMEAKGFPRLWIQWIKNLMTSSSSIIKINGSVTPTFFHRRGVRQGDPLSPLIFDLAVDILQDIFSKLEPHLIKVFQFETQVLQYADDTIIFMEAHLKNLRLLALALEMFNEITGLPINWTKSAFVPIAIPEEHLVVIKNILKCEVESLPIRYLGIPLTIKKPKKLAFMPLIKAVQERISSWKGRFLSIGGRITLIKATLGSLALHLMQVIHLPKWCINELNRTIRAFLWKGNDMQLRELPGDGSSNLYRCFVKQTSFDLTMENKVLVEDLSEDRLAQEIDEASLSDMQNKNKKRIDESSFFSHTQKTPWLVYFADGKEDETHTFYSVEENKSHVKNTLRGELYLVHTRQKSMGLSVTKINFSEMRWEVVDDIGDHMFFLNCDGKGIDYKGNEIVICRRGDSEWTEEIYDDGFEYDEETLWDQSTWRNESTTPVFLKDELHFLMRDCRIGVFNPITLSWEFRGKSKIIDPKTHRHHLVESNDELFWVFATTTGDSIHVYKLDRSNYEWKEVESLGGKCFFVGQYSSMSASTLDGKKDMVYFPMYKDGCPVGYSCAQQKLFCSENFYGLEELTLGSCWIEPCWTQHTVEDLKWF